MEKESITMSVQSSTALAVAILFVLDENKAISQSISSAETYHKCTSEPFITLETAILPVFSMYIEFASSQSRNKTSHVESCFS
jgi:hypothetical protein